MKQVFLSGAGQVETVDVPVPGRLAGGMLVRNAFSLISSGTEGAAVTRRSGAAGLYEKVTSSSDRLEQVWSMARSQGIANTAALIRNKLGDHTPIGYSSAGIVVETDGRIEGIGVGDRLACMGTGFANHAEFVTMPRRLVAPIPDGVAFEHAAFGAVACIAMQGIRRLELSPGERVAVVGLGLIGQLALRLAAAMGYRPCGYDLDAERVALAARHVPAGDVANSGETDARSHARARTDGVGYDGVVICAGTKSDVLINQTFEMCRKRGRVSIVGDVGLGLERARVYAKELEVRLSCSYGVGRYDPAYEIEGRDYPIAYVRWTEERNLLYFLDLLARGALRIDDLVSRTCPVDRSAEAYAAIKSGDGGVHGVLLDYDLPARPAPPGPEAAVQDYAPRAGRKQGTLGIGMIGLGAYAKNVHLPNLRRMADVDLRAVASRTGGASAVTARKIGAAYATTDVDRMLSDEQIEAVIVSTRHATHARFARAALDAGKHVFVEKPLATEIADCIAIAEAQARTGLTVRVGFNRRFAPMLVSMRAAVGAGVKTFCARINVGDVGTHWSNAAEEGGRLLGEGVHFFDLANFMMDAPPVAVTARFAGEASPLNPDAFVLIDYADGSVGQVVYTTKGHVGRGKEFYELFGNGRSAMVDDFKRLSVYGASAAKAARNDKGQFPAMAEFVAAARGAEGSGHGADARDGLRATAIALAAIQSGRRAERIVLDAFIDGAQDAP